MSALRTAGAVIAGFGEVVVLSTGTDAVLHATGLFPTSGAAMSGGLFACALAYRTVYTVLGGWITARLGGTWRAVAILAGLGQLGGLAGIAAWFAAADPSMGPLWYPVLLAAGAIPSVVAGGWLRLERG